MNKDKEIEQAFTELDEEAKNELLQFEKVRKLKMYRTLGVFGAIFSMSLLVAVGFYGDKVKTINLYNLHPIFEFMTALFFSLASGTLTTIISSKSKSEVKNSTLKEFIKHTYLTKLNESSLNPQTPITKQ